MRPKTAFGKLAKRLGSGIQLFQPVDAASGCDALRRLGAAFPIAPFSNIPPGDHFSAWYGRAYETSPDAMQVEGQIAAFSARTGRSPTVGEESRRSENKAAAPGLGDGHIVR